MRKTERPEEVIAAKIPAAIYKQVKRAARDEDRTVSSWLRRHLASVFAEQAPREDGSR